jgi:hypothetical protein
MLMRNGIPITWTQQLVRSYGITRLMIKQLSIRTLTLFKGGTQGGVITIPSA